MIDKEINKREELTMESITIEFNSCLDMEILSSLKEKGNPSEIIKDLLRDLYCLAQEDFEELTKPYKKEN